LTDFLKKTSPKITPRRQQPFAQETQPLAEAKHESNAVLQLLPLFVLHCFGPFCFGGVAFILLCLHYSQGRELCFLEFFGVFFQNISQNGRPGGREPPRSTSFDKTNQTKSV